MLVSGRVFYPVILRIRKGSTKNSSSRIGKYPSSLGSQNRSPKSHSKIAIDPTDVFLHDFTSESLGRDGAANLYRRLPFDGHSLSQVLGFSQPCYELLIRLLRRLAVNRIAEWMHGKLHIGDGSKTSKKNKNKSQSFNLYTKFYWKWMNMECLKHFEPYPSWCERI